MIDQDAFIMTDEESENCYNSLIAAENEIKNIVNLDPVSGMLK